MGLDIVELIFKIEDAFNIELTDDDVINFKSTQQRGKESVTVGDIYQIILSKQQGKQTNVCLTKLAFFRTRIGIIEALKIDRQAIKPSTQLSGIFPQQNRRHNWQAVQDAMGLNLPSLKHPGWFVLAMLGVGLSLSAVLGFLFHASFFALILLLIGGAILGGVLVGETPSLATKLPSHISTIGDLARDVLDNNFGKLSQEKGEWNELEVWNTLCRLIAMTTAINPREIVPGARLVEDLRLV